MGAGLLVITLGKSLNKVFKYIAHIDSGDFVGAHVCVIFAEIADDLVKHTGVIHAVDLIKKAHVCQYVDDVIRESIDE